MCPKFLRATALYTDKIGLEAPSGIEPENGGRSFEGAPTGALLAPRPCRQTHGAFYSFEISP